MRRSECYQRLGLRDGATEAEVKEAFRRQAKHVHPDVNAGAEAHEAFVRLLEAYRILRDEPLPTAAVVIHSEPHFYPHDPPPPVVQRRGWGVSLGVLIGLGVMLSASAVKPPEPPQVPPSKSAAHGTPDVAIAETPLRPNGPSIDSGRSAAEPGEAAPPALAVPMPSSASGTAPVTSGAKPPIQHAAPPTMPRRTVARRPGAKPALARNPPDRRHWAATLRAPPRRPRVEQWEEVEADEQNVYAPVQQPAPRPFVPQLPGLGLLNTLLGAR